MISYVQSGVKLIYAFLIVKLRRFLTLSKINAVVAALVRTEPPTQTCGCVVGSVKSAWRQKINKQTIIRTNRSFNIIIINVININTNLLFTATALNPRSALGC